MGHALHEMYKVSRQMIGDAPYEEYVPLIEKLHLLKKSDPLVYETYWEVLCHFHAVSYTHLTLPTIYSV